MDKIIDRHDEVLDRLYSELEKLQPGTDEYEKVLTEVTKAAITRNEFKKMDIAEAEAKNSKSVAEAETKNSKSAANKELAIKIVTIVAGVALTPVIDLACKRSLARFIGTVEQMETFTSTPGRSMSSWFRFKN